MPTVTSGNPLEFVQFSMTSTNEELAGKMFGCIFGSNALQSLFGTVVEFAL